MAKRGRRRLHPTSRRNVMTTSMRPAESTYVNTPPTDSPAASDTAGSTVTSDGAHVERTVAAERWLDRFTRAEIVQLLQFEDRHSWAAFAVNWGLVFASMALVARWPNPLTIVVAPFVIAGRPV